MGMFDSVMFVCPKCRGEVEAQSKAGDCSLLRFDPESVPMAVAVDLQGETVWCHQCQTPYTIKADVPSRATLTLE